MFSLKASLPRPVQFAVPTLLLLAFTAASRAQSRPGPELAHLRPQPQSVGVADPGSTWPSGVIYYDDGGCIAGNTCPNLAQAISTFNADFPGVVQWTERTSQTTYVVITLSGTGGRGDVDTIGYPAFAGALNLNCNTDCSVATLLHEMGHIIGLYHEHTRTDRDSYVTLNYNNVIKGSWTGNFAINTQNQQLLSPYDYASVMQYPSYVDSRNGGPVIETIPAGIPLQGTEGVPGAGNEDYSAGDKEAIRRLYGAAPTQVTVTSNPVGLQVLVDSVPCTTPCTESWTVGSTHNLSVADGVQTLTGNIENSGQSATFYYTYGRWSDSTQQTHSITVQGGNGSPAFPTGSPAIATYSANFVQLVPYTSITTGSGIVDASPEPQTYTGDASDVFFVAREQVTLTASALPFGGWVFYEFNAQAPYFWLPGGLSENPKTFFVPDTGNPVAVNAEFTTFPIYTVDVEPSSPIQNQFSSNLYAYVDGNFWTTPKNFSPDPALDGSAWDEGTTHTLSLSFNGDSTNPPEQPYSANTEFAFSSWSDGGAYSHTTAGLSPDGATYTATVTPLYQPATNFSSLPPCGGTAAITPASSNGGF
ncbi:MAG TPA: M12 family metallopeptidase [Acidobacteriaceae bacterium]|nr:M12 family metallopeptidase [Acidobacteriaceae bacterium]